MTGDESYHAACFTCKACHSPIAELVFAKTSQGIYCMKCHNQRVARSRRHADKRKGNGRSKTIDVKEERKSVSQSGSTEDGQIAASESDQTSTRTTLPTSPSSSSLSPLPTQKSHSSSGSIGKRPLHPPPPSLREMRESPSSHQWTAIPDLGRNRTPSLLQGEMSPRANTSALALLGASIDRDKLSSTASPKGEHATLKPASGLGIETEEVTKRVTESESPAIESKQLPTTLMVLRPSSDSEVDVDKEDVDTIKKVDVKRASKINPALSRQDVHRISKSFSFYDPDIVSLMDSMTRFGSSDELSLDVQLSRDQVFDKKNGLEHNAADEVNSREREEKGHKVSPKLKQASDSNQSLHRISDKMKESMKGARDGHVSMDTEFVESVLADLEETRERMKMLQKKYDRIRRASQQAAQGFSSAREEYEQEVQARYDAETEMLNLKRQLNLQATRLTEMTQEKKQQENLQRKSQVVKHSIQGLERDLAKLIVERDLTVAEVTELIALQDGRSLTSEGNEEHVKRTLTLRLDGVKDRYRQELNELQGDRDALLIEIEELRQTKEAVSEETLGLQNKYDQLKASLALLTRRVEHAQASASISQQQRQPIPPKGSVTPSSAGFGLGFSKQSRSGASPSYLEGPNNHPLPPEPNEKIVRLAPVPIAKAEAVPKKFKWKKAPKLTAESAWSASQQLAANLQGVINPSPPVPPKALSQQSSPYNHVTGLSLQQQQQQQQHQQQPNVSGTSSQQTSTDQSFASNVHSNGQTNGEIVVKEHLFQPYSVLRPTRCFACQKNMWGQSEMKCGLCNQVCHIRCLQSLPTSCNQPFTRSDEPAVEYTGPSMFGRALTEQIRSEGPDRKTPLIVEKCIQAVENLGMDYEGIYRKSGGTSQLKIITQLFDNRQPFNLENRDRFNDISAITSVLKNYFRELPEPLLTFDLHEKFIECTESKQEATKREVEMRELVRNLPREHYDTLKYLIIHLYRVQNKAEENRMSSRNLGVVFGRECR